MIKNRIFALVLASILIPAASAGNCTNRHIWFGPQCIGQGGKQDCSGWRFYKLTFAAYVGGSRDPVSMQNGAIIEYCPAFYVNEINIWDPHGDVRKFHVGGEFSDSYIFHDDIGNTGNIFLNTPANGDITINGSSWGSLICDDKAPGWNCSQRGFY